jgi:HD-like signal output (HDOD) protein
MNTTTTNSTDETGKTALENLLAAMDQGGDFPALSRTITEINQAVGDENSRASKMTEIILRDISLTKKLLRLVNAAHYGSFGSQPISTISRAVVILGFSAVRNAAVSLMLFEHLQNHANVDLLRGEAVDSFFRGVLGRMLAAGAGVRDGEEAFISALFRDLGRLMARFHFYEQTEQVAALMEADMLDESTASHRVLGADYDELGLAIARHWHFPPAILHAMTPLGAATLKKPGANENDRLQVVANMARDLHRSIAGKPAEEQAQSLDTLYLRYRDAVQISHDGLMETARKAAQTLRSEAVVLNVDVRKSPLIQQLLQDPAETGDAVETVPPEETPESDGNEATSVLALGMQDMTALMLGQYHLADIFKLLAELFYRSELFDDVVVSVLDRTSQSLIGRVSLGRNAAQMRNSFRIPLSFAPDVFHAATSNGQDILISDATAANIRTRIPEWYSRAFKDQTPAHAFLLLPVMVNNKPLGLIYADKLNQPLQIPSHLLGLLKALRNQAALALRQKL